MALTVAIDIANSNVVGNKREVTGTITFPNPYVVGGVPVTAAMFGLVGLDRLILEPATTADFTSAFVPRFHKAAATITLYKANGTTNLIEATAVDTSGYTCKFIARGY